MAEPLHGFETVATDLKTVAVEARDRRSPNYDGLLVS